MFGDQVRRNLAEYDENRVKESVLRRSGVGERYFDVSLDRIPDSVGYKDKIESYIHQLPEQVNDGVGLLLYGKYGTGKTSAAVIVMKEIIGRGGTSLMVPVRNLKDYKISDVEFDEEQTMMERMRNVTMLVLDDLGGEHSKEYARHQLEGVLRTRYDRNLPTIITTNFSKNELAEDYQAAMEIATASAHFVKVDGKDWREDERIEVGSL